MNYPYEEDQPSSRSSEHGAQKTEPLPQLSGNNRDNWDKPQDPLRSTVLNGGKPATALAEAPAPSLAGANELITAKYLTASLNEAELIENTRQTLQRLPVRTGNTTSHSIVPVAPEKPAPPVEEVEESSPENEDEKLTPRQSERFEFLPDAGVRVRVAWNAGGELREIYGDLLDISGTGLRFISDDCVPADCELDIAMMAPAPELYVTAVSCWSRPESTGFWCTGCRLEVEFPVDVFTEMGARGQINRRRERRKPVSIPALVSFELDTAKELNTEIIDISTGGMCIAMPGNYELGTRILVRVQSDRPVQSVPLIVRWNSPSEHAPVVGGSFLNRAGYEAFAASLSDEVMPEAPQVETETKKTPKRRLLQKAVAGLVVASCLVAIVLMFRDIGVKDHVAQVQIIHKGIPASELTRYMKPQPVAAIAPVTQPVVVDTPAESVVAVDTALKSYAAQADAPVEYRLAPDVADLLLFAAATTEATASQQVVVQTPSPVTTQPASDVVMQVKAPPTQSVEPDATPDSSPGIEENAVSAEPELASIVSAVTKTQEAKVTVHNPARNRGAVSFVWATSTVTLPAGATVELPVDGSAAMTWDRGAAFGQANRELKSGQYEFAVSPETGWLLQQAPQPSGGA